MYYDLFDHNTVLQRHVTGTFVNFAAFATSLTLNLAYGSPGSLILVLIESVYMTSYCPH